MTRGLWEGDVFKGLAFRILVFLSLALLPFGLISILQTREIARQADAAADLSLLGLTEQASSAERTIIQEGFGAAEALSSIVGTFAEDAETCVSFLQTYQQQSQRYSLVGFLPADGVMTCSSAGGVYDFAADPEFSAALKATKRTVLLSRSGPVSQEPVMVILHPHFDQDRFVGFSMLSVPLSVLRKVPDVRAELHPHDVITFNVAGEVLSSDRARAASSADLPRNRSIKALVGAATTVFEDVNTQGEDRVYAVVPIIPDVTYAMGVWRRSDVLTGARQARALSIFLPVLMWLASLVVAFWAINRLAIRHIRKLGRQMSVFAKNRALPRSTLGGSVPQEFVEIQTVFMGMADSILRDEATLENSLREKNILLKEVHHRVKNNLQLISSIMNMQIRRAPTEESRLVLRRLQERILSLATVHKNLYQNDEGLDRVDAGALVEEVVGQLLVVGLPAGTSVEVAQSYAPVILHTDDAAPLTLLVSEALTNAMKNIGSPDPEHPSRLEIHLEQPEAERAVFCIRNTLGMEPAPEGTGLGMQLINAFARQLNAQISADIHVDGDAGERMHRLMLSFPVPQYTKPVLDY